MTIEDIADTPGSRQIAPADPPTDDHLSCLEDDVSASQLNHQLVSVAARARRTRA
jgi:hypothetical protein